MSRRIIVSIVAIAWLVGAAPAQVPYGVPTPGPGGVSPVLSSGAALDGRTWRSR